MYLAIHLIRWTLVTLFIASLTTAVVVRDTGYTDVAVENGRYFVMFRSTRYQVSRQEFEKTRWHNHVAGGAVAVMMLSLFAFIGIEHFRKRVRIQ